MMMHLKGNGECFKVPTSIFATKTHHTLR